MLCMAEQRETTPASWDMAAVQRGELSHPTELLAPRGSSGLALAWQDLGLKKNSGNSKPTRNSTEDNLDFHGNEKIA